MRKYNYYSLIKLIRNMTSPSDRRYTKEHLWVQKTAEGEWLAGITDYAQDLLGDIVYFDPPKVGTTIESTTPCGIVESVKTGSDLHAPMDGVVTSINEALVNEPEEINDAPYKAWIFKFEPTNSDDMAHLMDAEAYEALIAEA
jgi:glycine cleavage system H protein